MQHLRRGIILVELVEDIHVKQLRRGILLANLYQTLIDDRLDRRFHDLAQPLRQTVEFLRLFASILQLVDGKNIVVAFEQFEERLERIFAAVPLHQGTHLFAQCLGDAYLRITVHHNLFLDGFCYQFLIELRDLDLHLLSVVGNSSEGACLLSQQFVGRMEELHQFAQ